MNPTFYIIFGTLLGLAMAAAFYTFNRIHLTRNRLLGELQNALKAEKNLTNPVN